VTVDLDEEAYDRQVTERYVGLLLAATKLLEDAGRSCPAGAFGGKAAVKAAIEAIKTAMIVELRVAPERVRPRLAAIADEHSFDLRAVARAEAIAVGRRSGGRYAARLRVAKETLLDAAAELDAYRALAPGGESAIVAADAAVDAAAEIQTATS
jgi:hypothetical protein